MNCVNCDGCSCLYYFGCSLIWWIKDILITHDIQLSKLIYIWFRSLLKATFFGPIYIWSYFYYIYIDTGFNYPELIFKLSKRKESRNTLREIHRYPWCPEATNKIWYRPNKLKLKCFGFFFFFAVKAQS